MLLEVNHSLLLIVDVQEKLVPVVCHKPRLINNLLWILELCQMLGLPVLVSEQYPKGLGKTILEIDEKIIEAEYIEKTEFSCARNQEFKKILKNFSKPQIILMGIEAHVCILQTALDLKEQGYQVFVVADAISSRNEEDLRYALQRMNLHGIDLLSKEMVYFELLRDSSHEKFKMLNKHFMKN